jgi:hypothetical protein
MKPVMDQNEERDSKYPAFRRWDVSKWQKWKFSPGAITLMPFRLLATIFLVGLCYIFVRIATLGHNFDKPIEGWFKNLVIGSAYKYLSALVILVCGIRSTKSELTDFDYSYYLGKNYKETTVTPKYVSTYVSNHTAWVDILMLLSFYRPAFAAK